jgi:hypothetical protein
MRCRSASAFSSAKRIMPQMARTSFRHTAVPVGRQTTRCAFTSVSLSHKQASGKKERYGSMRWQPG